MEFFLYENNLNYCCEKNFSPYMAHSPKISIRNGKNRHKTCNMKNSAIHFNYVTMYSTDILPVNWYKSYFVTVGEQLYDMWCEINVIYGHSWYDIDYYKLQLSNRTYTSYSKLYRRVYELYYTGCFAFISHRNFFPCAHIIPKKNKEKTCTSERIVCVCGF